MVVSPQRDLRALSRFWANSPASPSHLSKSPKCDVRNPFQIFTFGTSKIGDARNPFTIRRNEKCRMPPLESAGIPSPQFPQAHRANPVPLHLTCFQLFPNSVALASKMCPRIFNLQTLLCIPKASTPSFSANYNTLCKTTGGGGGLLCHSPLAYPELRGATQTFASRLPFKYGLGL
jgi:hypothetical protein